MTERIGDLYECSGKVYAYKEEKECLYPEHNPPQLMDYTPGKYKHTCPRCGKVTLFEIYPRGATL